MNRPAWFDTRDELVAAGLLSEFLGGRSLVDHLVRRHVVSAASVVLDALQAAGLRATWVRYRRATLYRANDGTIGGVRLSAYSGPFVDTFSPFTYRFTVDGMSEVVSARAARDLGVRPRSLVGTRPERLELSVLPREVSAFGAWLPSWILARDAGEPHPEPPFAMSRPGPVQTYAWSFAANQQITAWSRLSNEIRAYREAQRAARHAPPSNVVRVDFAAKRVLPGGAA